MGIFMIQANSGSYFWWCILSHEVVRYLTKINLYNLMWKVLRWSQKDKSNTMRQKVPDFLIVFCPLMKLSEPGSDPGYLIELIIRHLGHPLEIKTKRWVWNILLKKIILTFIAFITIINYHSISHNVKDLIRTEDKLRPKLIFPMYCLTLSSITSEL